MKKSGLADSPFFSPPKSAELKTAPPAKEEPGRKNEAGTEKEGSVYRSDEGPEVKPGNRSAGQTPTPPADKPAEQPTNRPADQPTGQSTNQLTNRPTDQSTNQLTGESTAELPSGPVAVDELGPVVEKPKSFYVTHKIDHWLDEAVRYMKAKGLHKADRSVLVNALLRDPGHYTPEALDKLRPKLLVHLTNKGLKRVQSSE